MEKSQTPRVGDKILMLKGIFKGSAFRVTEIIDNCTFTTILGIHFVGEQGDRWRFTIPQPDPLKIDIATKQGQATRHDLLKLELDYELVSLNHAINNNDTAEVERSKRRLAELHEELYPQMLEGF